MTHTRLYLDCAHAFAGIVARVGCEEWTRPALGVWDVRALAGHTGRALTTVADYLAEPEPAGDAAVITAPEYYARFASAADRTDADAAVAARGVEAGAALGEDPPARVAALVTEAERALAAASPGRVVATRFGTLRLEECLRTRTFELVVHGLDLTRALGAPATLVPPAGVAAALELAAQTAALSGTGPQVLAALTGRSGLPHGFSVL